MSGSFRLGYWQVVFQVATFEGPPRHPCESVHSVNWQHRSGTREGEQGWREFWESFSKRRRSGKGWDVQGIECEGKWKEGRGRILANPHLRGGRWSCIGGPTGVVSRERREWAPGSHQKRVSGSEVVSQRKRFQRGPVEEQGWEAVESVIIDR